MQESSNEYLGGAGGGAGGKWISGSAGVAS